jgi:ubiquinone/menaquinone biosynthesis C-methylase UbiE/uncharacterized protein YbaR (Trm112 family)
MNPQLLPFLADPNDGLPLELHAFAEHGASDKRTVREGILVQPQSGRWYPIRDGIPSMFADALRVGDELASDRNFLSRYREAVGAAGGRFDVTPGHAAEATQSTSGGDFARIDSERRARDEQAESYDQMISLKVYEWIETPTYRRALSEAVAGGNGGSTFLQLSPLLEAGCGTGRFTGLFASMAQEVVAVDMSRDSILRNRLRHSGKTIGQVHYIHADLTHMPLRSNLFGGVAHCGVYEHIPSRELREKFLSHAQRTLKSDGALLLSAYRYGGITKYFGKQGEHAGGIPFTRFTEEELRSEVEPYFNIEHFRPNLGIYMSMLVGKPKAN